MFSYFEPNFIEKFLWERDFSNLAKIEMTRNKDWLFGRHFETEQLFIFYYFFWCSIMIVYGAYIYGANFIAKFRYESGFLPLGP